MTMELKVINSFMFYNRYTAPAVKYLPVLSCPEGGGAVPEEIHIALVRFGQGYAETAGPEGIFEGGTYGVGEEYRAAVGCTQGICFAGCDSCGAKYETSLQDAGYVLVFL